MIAKNHKKYFIIFICIAVLVSVGSAYIIKKSDCRKASDSDFILIDEKISKNEKLKLITYKFDIGALGYSRIFWAVVPHEYSDINLRSHELPDGYKGVGWTEKNELLIEEWKPYYFIEREFELNDGEFYKGAQIKIIKNTKR